MPREKLIGGENEGGLREVLDRAILARTSCRHQRGDGVGNAGVIIVVAAMDGHLDGSAVSLALGAIGLTGTGGIAIRSQVVPMNKDRQMGEPPPVVKVDEVVVT